MIHADVRGVRADNEPRGLVRDVSETLLSTLSFQSARVTRTPTPCCLHSPGTGER